MARIHRLQSWIGVAIATVAASTLACAKELESPNFRGGLWHFQTTTEQVHKSSKGSDVRIEETTRCVDPTVSMKYTFRSPDVGSCRSAKPQLIDNRYIFTNRCDHMGPVRTEIVVESDKAYREINELSIGTSPRKETVVARRIGDCPK